jgi:mediator of RNA polymerase II transcription subunit 23
VVGGVDYKGVREIMKNCIEKAQTLPTHLHLSVRPQAEALTDVLAYIFNREEIGTKLMIFRSKKLKE